MITLSEYPLDGPEGDADGFYPRPAMMTLGTFFRDFPWSDALFENGRKAFEHAY